MKKEKMTTTTSPVTGILYEDDIIERVSVTETPKKTYKWKLLPGMILLISLCHIGGLYGVYLIFTSAKLLTILFVYFMVMLSALGITAGSHRLWAHRAYKSKWQLDLILMIFNTFSCQKAVIPWVRTHRLHHKYSETDADPHNAKRGLFFAHIGWLLCEEHPDVITKGKGIDISDVESNPILAFQMKYYSTLMPILCIIIPTMIPVLCWNETWENSFFIGTVLRIILVLNFTWSVNSLGHLLTLKPYDRNINPADNMVLNKITFGEGWHNFHHVFPWDYKSSELGTDFNLTTSFIHAFAKIGWAYDLKSVSDEMLRKRVQRTGDGSHPVWGHLRNSSKQANDARNHIENLHLT